jgi:hypothetical protein
MLPRVPWGTLALPSSSAVVETLRVFGVSGEFVSGKCFQQQRTPESNALKKIQQGNQSPTVHAPTFRDE